MSSPITRGGADTSLFGPDTLVGGTVDFTAFKLTAAYTHRSSFTVTRPGTRRARTHRASNGAD